MTDGTIYGLHAGDGQVRYVGLTRATPLERLNRHRRSAIAGSHFPVHRWMVKHGPEEIHIAVLEEVREDRLAERERWWIKELRDSGSSLLNATDGGEGVQGLSPEARERISISKRGEKHPAFGKPAYIRGRKMPSPPPEVVAQRSAALRKTWATKRESFVPGQSHYGRTHCPHGHEYTPENTGISKSEAGYPVRWCRACRAAYKRRVRASKKEVSGA